MQLDKNLCSAPTSTVRTEATQRTVVSTDPCALTTNASTVSFASTTTSQPATFSP